MSPVDADIPSTRPYLIRALHEWCSDNGFSPYIAVQVDASVQVPMEFVKNGEIVLNVGIDATSALRLGNDFIEFKARFGGVAREIVVPISHVIAIYARENGQGMAFPAPAPAMLSALKPQDEASGGPQPLTDPVSRSPLRSVTSEDAETEGDDLPPEPPNDGPGRAPGRPQLKRVK
ncbi:ClpXP protease specificity-enhancing factor [Hydrogenophaga sp.]|uniref:ClpXP protease specificity-enhancing factor n=1 Tax=Hydrogenophaga sp. TaxID=1904254 RepID=UPI0026142D52|nr:ClpXP protease specificity-enhancing factor [Hydrogenophaga sp.]